MINKSKDIKAYRYTSLAMSMLQKLLGSKIKVEGLANIPDGPVLFVSNHFTRSETFIVPYIIYKHTKRQVRCLADSNLFHGVLGRFLKSVGAISTKDTKRDLTIVSDLVLGKYDWMIYPEGSMIKNKEIRSGRKFPFYSTPYLLSDTAGGVEGRVRTGSAVLALKSELYRMDLIEAKKNNSPELLKYYQNELGIEFNENIKNLQTNIVPLNITYYPIRPGSNIIQRIVGRLFKKLPSQISEELEIEGNLLMSAYTNLSFGKPINVADYVRNARSAIYQIPIIKNETKVNLILKYLKYRLTNQFMGKIYSDTEINMDHIVAAVLHFYPQNEISIVKFRVLIYICVTQIRSLGKYRMNEFLVDCDFYKIFSGEVFTQFTDIINLAKNLDIIKESDDQKKYIINKIKLEQKFDFWHIRIDNTIQVMLNEFLLLTNAVDVVRKNVLLGEEEAKQKSFNYIIYKDSQNFDDDYKKYYDADLSKNKTFGMPLFLDNKDISTKNRNGILLVHGYLSVPAEMEEMARYFNNLGFKTYSARLKGHGTAPINLEDVVWQDWYSSLNCGYAALKLICDKVFIIGFSTGALLALMASFEKYKPVDGIICINPALKLRDIRAKFAQGVNIWNDLLEKFKIEKGQLRYVENHSENPDINYPQNYIKGVEQLEILMSVCESNLKNVTCPTLFIQSSDDQVVDAQNAKVALQKIGSNIKKFVEVKSQRHVIIRGLDSNEVFVIVKDFFKENNLL